MGKGVDGVSLLLGIAAAIIAAQLVLVATPLAGRPAQPPLLPPYSRYAVFSYGIGYKGSINVTSMSTTYQLNITVTARPGWWNVSEPVMLRIGGVLAENNAGEIEVPPGPYNITITPALAILNPNSSVVFTVSFIPWPSAGDLYDEYSNVTFIWGVACESYPVENPTSEVLLASDYIFMEKGEGSRVLPS